MSDDYNIHLSCPWGCHGEILATHRAKLRVSVMCSNCNHSNFYIAELYSLNTYRSKARDAKNFGYHIKCPCCGSGKISADGKGDVILSVICPKCRETFIADLNTMKATPSKRIRKKGRLK